MITPASPWIGSTRKATVYRGDGVLQRLGVPEGDDHKTRSERREPVLILRLGAETDDGDRPAVEVVRADDHLGPALGHALIW